MDARRQFTVECLIDHPVALDPALSFERLRHDINPKMRFSARPMPGMAFVLVRFIDNADGFRGESFGQPSCDDLLGCLLHGGLEMRVAEIYGGSLVDRMRKAVEITSYGSVKLAGRRNSSA